MNRFRLAGAVGDGLCFVTDSTEFAHGPGGIAAVVGAEDRRPVRRDARRDLADVVSGEPPQLDGAIASVLDGDHGAVDGLSQAAVGCDHGAAVRLVAEVDRPALHQRRPLEPVRRELAGHVREVEVGRTDDGRRQDRSCAVDRREQVPRRVEDVELARGTRPEDEAVAEQRWARRQVRAVEGVRVEGPTVVPVSGVERVQHTSG